MPVFGDTLPARAYAMTERPATDFRPGTLQETGRDLDVAVGGKGWIAVQAPDGSEAYVRTASLNVDALGVLRTGNGLPVMGNAGPIAVPPEQKIEIGQDGTISIRAGKVDNRIAIVIADTGIGIPKNALDKIGRPFEQVENQLTKTKSGSGLGLAISKSLIELHDGELRIESVEGHGTAVSVFLPAERQQDATRTLLVQDSA